MHQPLVSVVLVVCNVERFLSEAVQSILRQTFADFEFIIVDFGSTDRSEMIASSFAQKDSRIKLHKIPHCGLAEARNAGCFLAEGKYIAIMDADDVSLPNRLLWEVEFAEKHPEVHLLGGVVEWIDGKGRSLGVHDCPSEHRNIQSALLTDNPIWQPTVLIRRDTFVALGGYRGIFAPAEDYDMWLRIAEHHQIANLKEVVLQYRIHPYQVSMRKQREQSQGRLAAQASASLRKSGQPDGFNQLKELTPGVLAELGISEAAQDRSFVDKSHWWICNMYRVGEYSTALKAIIEMQPSVNWEYIGKRQTAAIWLIAAKLYWREKSFRLSLGAAIHSVKLSPRVLGYPLKPLLRGLSAKAGSRARQYPT